MNSIEKVDWIYRKFSNLPEVSCIVHNPLLSGLFLGFENGSIVRTSDDGSLLGSPEHVSLSGEAINGIASVKSSTSTLRPWTLAVSTRSEVTFCQFGPNEVATRSPFNGGAHGLVTTRYGAILAPLGPGGLLVVQPSDEPIQRMDVLKSPNEQPYLYRLAVVADVNGMETLVSANRRNGLGLSELQNDGKIRNVHTFGFEGIDVVDVCAVASRSLSAIAITSGSELLWIEDSSRRENPRSFPLPGVEGTIYRVLATPRHLFTLTSKALYVWKDLVTGLQAGHFQGLRLLQYIIPMDAVDVSMIDEKDLYLIPGEEEILCLNIAEMEAQMDLARLNTPTPSPYFEQLASTSFRDVNRDWQLKDIKQEATRAA